MDFSLFEDEHLHPLIKEHCQNVLVPCRPPPVCLGKDVEPSPAPPHTLQFIASWLGHKRTHPEPSALNVKEPRPRKRVCVCGCVDVWMCV